MTRIIIFNTSVGFGIMKRITHVTLYCYFSVFPNNKWLKGRLQCAVHSFKWERSLPLASQLLTHDHPSLASVCTAGIHCFPTQKRISHTTAFLLTTRYPKIYWSNGVVATLVSTVTIFITDIAASSLSTLPSTICKNQG